MEGENEWLMANWHYGPEIPVDRRATPPNNSLRSDEARCEAHWTHLHFGNETGEGIMSFVTPLSTAEELHAARNINLKCLASEATRSATCCPTRHDIDTSTMAAAGDGTQGLGECNLETVTSNLF